MMSLGETRRDGGREKLPSRKKPRADKRKYKKKKMKRERETEVRKASNR